MRNEQRCCTLEVMFRGRGFSLAFASKDDALRFQYFLTQHESECGLPTEWTEVYALDPASALIEHARVPPDAAWVIDHQVVLQMIMRLVEVRVPANEPQPVPKLDMSGSPQGTTFRLSHMPVNEKLH